jgi:hypothetical protein
MDNNRLWPVNIRDKIREQITPWRFRLCSLLLGCFVLLSSGCSRPNADQLLRDYQQRLDRVLSLTPVDVELAALPPLPAIRDLQHPIAPSQLNLLDLVALRHCHLQQLVAERNNSLGKVMTSSNLLGYELQLLVTMQPCLNHPELSTKLRADLQQIYTQKQQQLRLVLDNFLTSDPTLRKQLSGQPRLLVQGASQAVAQPLTALKNLNLLKQQILAGQQEVYKTLSADFINQQLGVLYQGNFVADWQFSIRRSNAWLSALDLQLSKVDVTSLCQQPAQLEILNNILTQIFTTRVQSYLAELDGLSYQLVPELQQLYLGTALQSTVEVRLAQPALQLRQLLKQHISWYQQLQQQCGTKPPSPRA